MPSSEICPIQWWITIINFFSNLGMNTAWKMLPESTERNNFSSIDKANVIFRMTLTNNLEKSEIMAKYFYHLVLFPKNMCLEVLSKVTIDLSQNFIKMPFWVNYDVQHENTIHIIINHFFTCIQHQLICAFIIKLWTKILNPHQQ